MYYRVCHMIYAGIQLINNQYNINTCYDVLLWMQVIGNKRVPNWDEIWHHDLKYESLFAHGLSCSWFLLKSTMILPGKFRLWSGFVDNCKLKHFTLMSCTLLHWPNICSVPISLRPALISITFKWIPSLYSVMKCRDHLYHRSRWTILGYSIV